MILPTRLRFQFLKSVRKALVRFTEVIWFHPGKILFAVSLVSMLGGWYTFQLFQDVRTDFSTLLPDTDRSVRHLKQVTDKMGGLGNIFVAISSPDFSANKKFATDMAAKLAKYSKSEIKFIDWNTGGVRDFFQRNAFYYLEVKELEQLYRAFSRRFQKSRLDAIGLDLDDSDPDAEIRSLIRKITAKYSEKNPLGANLDGFITNKTGTILTIIIRPAENPSNLDFSRNIINKLNADIASLNPKNYHPSMDVGLAGTYSGLLENFAAVIEDTVATAGLTIGLVLLSIFLYYKSTRMVFALCAGVLAGILCTFMLTWFKIGYLNQQTVFLASIIVGNGINFGLIQMARYLEERSRGMTIRRSIKRSILLTMSATLMAAFSTSLSYSILSMTTFKGFSQFGFIGGIGMICCWTCLMLVVPSILSIIEKKRPIKGKKLERYKHARGAELVAAIITKYDRKLVFLLLILTPLTIFLTITYISKDRFEYNLKKISIKVPEGSGTEQYYIKKIDEIMGNGTNSSLLLAKDRESAHKYAKRLQNHIDKQKNDGKDSTLSNLRWLDYFYPQEMAAKFAIMQKIRNIFPEKYIELVRPQERKMLRGAYKAIQSQPFTVQDLPPMVLQFFKESDNTLGRVIYVTAIDSLNLSHVKDLIKISAEVESVLPEIKEDTLYYASESMIFTDIINNISREGPLVTFICFLSVGVLIFAGFRRLKDFLFVYVFLTLGMLAYIASLQVFSVSLNFFNFITIPITIGIGVDYGINVYYRYKIEGEKSVRQVIRHTGSAVALCSWTTIIGYGTMLPAKNQAMASFGLMAVIGEIACLIYGVVFMSAWLSVKERGGMKYLFSKKTLTAESDIS